MAGRAITHGALAAVLGVLAAVGCSNGDDSPNNDAGGVVASSAASWGPAGENCGIDRDAANLFDGAVPWSVVTREGVDASRRYLIGAPRVGRLEKGTVLLLGTNTQQPFVDLAFDEGASLYAAVQQFGGSSDYGALAVLARAPDGGVAFVGVCANDATDALGDFARESGIEDGDQLIDALFNIDSGLGSEFEAYWRSR